MQNETHLSNWKNYTAAWADISADERRKLLQSSVSEDCVYTDPANQCHGREELTAAIEKAQQKRPGQSFKVTGFNEHHGQAIAHWTLFDGSGAESSKGESYARFGEDGLLTQMTGFPDAS